jgi:4-amino-4-deoxy-L-arabinose transferase-like glycosyltransferase
MVADVMQQPRADRRVGLLVVVVLIANTAVLFLALRRNFATVDEVGHLAAGLSHWQTSNYSMYRVNPPLARMVAVLPVLLAWPDTLHIVPSETPGMRTEWASGRAFAADNACRYHDLVCLARLAGVGWSLLGAWLVYRWARELYGTASGLLALVLWCFGPNVLAYAQLVIPDVPSTVAGLAASYCFWHYLRTPSWRLACLTGVLLGIAQLTKFTMLLLYGVWPVLWLVHSLPDAESPSGHRVPLRTQAAQGLLILLLSLLVLNLGYGFDGSFRPLGDFPFISRTFTGERLEGTASGNRFRDNWLGEVPVPLPQEYLRGIDAQRRDFERLGPQARSYLAGKWREVGWWHYYLHALAVKVPLGVWILVLWSLVLTLCGHPSSARWKDELTLWLPALAVLIVVSSQTGFNHHMRYVLPMFPFVIISTSKLGYFLRVGYWKTGLVVLALLVWALGSTARVHPHYMSYFNELAGGPDRGHDHLVDSNIDWGQDLLFLKDWLEDHPEARPLGLAYYNIVDPRMVGIEFTLPPFGVCEGPLPSEEAALRVGPQPGYYAVSVNYVRGSSTIMAPDGKGGRHPLARNAYSYFYRFEPIAKAGYSIFIYHITAEEANRVRRQYGLPPLPEARPAGSEKTSHRGGHGPPRVRRPSHAFVPSRPPVGLHAGGIAGRDRHPWDPHRDSAASHPEDTRDGQPHPVCQQPQTDRPGLHDASRYPQGLPRQWRLGPDTVHPGGQWHHDLLLHARLRLGNLVLGSRAATQASRQTGRLVGLCPAALPGRARPV